MDNKCEYTEKFTEKDLVITNEYGCEWNNGIGISPNGDFCGECDVICTNYRQKAKDERRT